MAILYIKDNILADRIRGERRLVYYDKENMLFRKKIEPKNGVPKQSVLF
jgi:hypothetical protein